MAWTLATAKNQLSEVVRKTCAEGPQTISVRGRDTVVVVTQELYNTFSVPAPQRDLKAVLMAAPKVDLELPPRLPFPPRPVEF